MDISTAAIDEALDALRALDGQATSALSPDALVDGVQLLTRIGRLSDALRAALAGELERRSTPSKGDAGVARQQGYRDVRRMIASTAGTSLAEAQRSIDAGRMLLGAAAGSDPAADASGPGLPGAPNVGGSDGLDSGLSGGLSGGLGGGLGSGGASSATAPAGREPAGRAHLASAVRAGDIAVDRAALVTRTLDRITELRAALASTPDSFTPPEWTDPAVLEERLVDGALRLTYRDLNRMCQRAIAATDPRAWEQQEERQHRERHVTIAHQDDGMVSIRAVLDPPSAAPVIALLEAHVKDGLRRRSDAIKEGAEHVDDRTAIQMRADALTSIARHALGCDQTPSGVTTTVVVRINHDDLQDGLGIGDADDLPHPVSAGAARRMAADAQIIPAVLGTDSQVLDLGRSVRLFTKAQRLALGERDGGCAICHAPPSYCEAHHIRWWTRDRGPTDLENGVLLCVSCHHRIHDETWKVHTDGNDIRVTPPRSAFPAPRTTRPPGRHDRPHSNPPRRPHRVGGRAALDPSRRPE
ncbi:HNH endonuclease signature motif containing protein [Demequina zhanjiangensis]|uniref:DUF222 domain-containing protein n=1 Tax=Demequina zhanjiangensis TaxID=3051659 RepID=A0ABT8FYX0_9MICO|nr:HNH endonuclease signature motif containing protein [Demequina sp. SYSU T00b26]MDN4472037.1 DUF222 domain-containing protein [Demequina sp. SYSU T00b26]